VDLDCVEAEQNEELSAESINRCREKICEAALSKLADFGPFAIAEKALTENIRGLERLSDRDPKQVEMLDKLKRALGELREGVQATRRMILDRGKMRQGVLVR
jgi:hypothetical protein